MLTYLVTNSKKTNLSKQNARKREKSLRNNRDASMRETGENEKRS